MRAVIDGHNPEKGVLKNLETDLNSAVLENRALLMGLQISIDLWAKMEDSGHPLQPKCAAENPRTSPSTQPARRYSDIVKLTMSKSVIKQRTAPKKPETHSVRKQIAEKNKEIRVDSRSFRLKSASPNGAIQPTHLVDALLKTLEVDDDPRTVVEDVRTDRFGGYYCQVSESQYDSLQQKIKCRLTHSKQLHLEGLGLFHYDDPVSSVTKGKNAIVVRNVDLGWSEDDFVAELWHSNRLRWGLDQDESVNQHLAAPKRLNRRKNDLDNDDDPEWIPSRNFKVWVSREVMDQLSSNGACVRFGYQFLGARLFVEKNQQCERCLQSGHIAATCRNHPKCQRCYGKHLTSECKSVQTRCSLSANEDPSKRLQRSEGRKKAESNDHRASDIDFGTDLMSEDEDIQSEDDGLNERLRASLNMKDRDRGGGSSSRRL